VCLDDECRQWSGNHDAFVDFGATYVHDVSQTVRKCDKIDSAVEWIEAIQEAYDTYNVPEARRNVLPMEGGCLTRACPTEEDLCATKRRLTIPTILRSVA
jgi:hypothetical protein